MKNNITKCTTLSRIFIMFIALALILQTATFMVFAASKRPPVFTANTSLPATGPVSITINFPDKKGESKEYSLDGGASWKTYSSPIAVYRTVNVLAKYKVKKNEILQSEFYVIINSQTDGDWLAKNVVMHNTPEADLMVRVGDIDNFGFNFKDDFNPFSGDLTQPHDFPWTTPSDEPQGLDKIMVVSGFNYNGSLPHDGYSMSTTKSKYQIHSLPININYQNEIKGINVSTAKVQMFVDDFQAGNAKGISGGNVKYVATINGVQVDGLSTVINNLDESGPIGRMVTFTIPDNLLPLVRTGSLSFKFDDTRAGISGDGYAIDFVKLLINAADLDNTSTISGKVTNTVGAPISSASVSISGINTKTATDGTYSLLKVPAGQSVIEAAKDGYNTGIVTKDVVGKSVYNNVNFSLTSTTKPTIPIITPDVVVKTKDPFNINISYPGGPAVTQYSILQSNGVDVWRDYTGSIQVSNNLTVKAKSISRDKVESDVSTYDVTNFDFSVPSTPVITQNPDAKTPTNQSVKVTVSYPTESVNKLISIDGGATFTNYVGPITVIENTPQNTPIVAKCSNYLNTFSPEARYWVANINKVVPPAPTITPSTKEIVVAPAGITVKANFPTEASNKKISVDNGAIWNNYYDNYPVNKNTTVKAKYNNTAGTTSIEGIYMVDNIDFKPATPIISKTPDNNIFTTGAVLVTIAKSEATQNVTLQYSTNVGNSWREYDAAGIIVTVNNTTIYARAITSKGTPSNTVSNKVTNIITPVNPGVNLRIDR